MEQQKLEKIMAFAFILISIALITFLLSFVDIVPFFIAGIFIVLATIASLLTGIILLKDSRQQ